MKQGLHKKFFRTHFYHYGSENLILNFLVQLCHGIVFLPPSREFQDFPRDYMT